MKTDLIFLLVIAAYVGYYLCKKETFTENFGEVEDEAARKAVRAIYNADIESIKTLSDVAKKLQAGGLTHPGRLFVNAGNDHLPITAASNGEAHIALRSHNNEGINNYLINRGGHFRLHTHGVGDMFGVNRDGHHYVRHLGDHVMHIEGDGNNPYISLGKTGTWNGQKLYLQNMNAHTGDPFFRVGRHGAAPLLDIYSNGTLNTPGGFIANNAIQNGWISGNFGVGGKDRVVIGNLENTATVGAHNNALNAWTTLNLRGEQVNLVTHNGRINLGNGWNIRTGDGHFRLYHGNDHQFVVHNPHAGAEWGNVVAGKRMRADNEIMAGGTIGFGNRWRWHPEGNFASLRDDVANREWGDRRLAYYRGGNATLGT
jgi:hypothetical protein